MQRFSLRPLSLCVEVPNKRLLTSFNLPEVYVSWVKSQVLRGVKDSEIIKSELPLPVLVLVLRGQPCMAPSVQGSADKFLCRWQLLC